MEDLGMCLPYVKRYFQKNQITHILLFFGNVTLGQIKGQTLTTTHFQQFFCYGSFRYLSTLRKKVFSATPVKLFFLSNSNNSDSVVFRNTSFGGIKDHSLTTKPSQKNFCYECFRYVSTWRKKVFSAAPSET